jgi:hypothetical protein
VFAQLPRGGPPCIHIVEATEHDDVLEPHHDLRVLSFVVFNLAAVTGVCLALLSVLPAAMGDDLDINVPCVPPVSFDTVMLGSY